MKIGVLGSGIVGQVLASGCLKHGHEVMLAARDDAKPDLGEWASKNPGGKTGDFAAAAAFADLVILATLGRAAVSAVKLAGVGNLAGKTLLDTTNPIADAPPIDNVLQFTTGAGESLGEQVQAAAPDCHVVKAYNSVGNALMINPHFEQGTPTMFLCGNDAGAKAQVESLIRQFGWEPFDCGSIVASRALEPLCMLWCIPAFSGASTKHAFRMLTK